MCSQEAQESPRENVRQRVKQNTEIPSHRENREIPSARDIVCKMCVYVGWAHLAAESLWGLGRFEARQPSDICLVNEAAGWALPFALKRSGFAGTQMQRRWHCSMAAFWWHGWHWEKVVALENNVAQVSKGAGSGSCRTTTQCSRCPENILFSSKHQLFYV